MRRVTLTTALLGLIFFTCALVAFRLFRITAFFAQPDARGYVLRLAAVFVAYAFAAVWAGKKDGTPWKIILNIAFSFGLATGAIEILNVAVENGLAFGRGDKLFQVAGILGVFGIWGIAGIWATRRLKLVKAGLLASIASAMICMLIGITGGVLIELFLAPTARQQLLRGRSSNVAAGLIRLPSRWQTPLDSAFSHLLLAPVVATIFGVIGSLLGRFLWAAT